MDAQWERDESVGYTSLSVVMPPRYLSWYADASGCSMDVGIVGAMRLPCPAGGPPAPPALLP